MLLTCRRLFCMRVVYVAHHPRTGWRKRRRCLLFFFGHIWKSSKTPEDTSTTTVNIRKILTVALPMKFYSSSARWTRRRTFPEGPSALRLQHPPRYWISVGWICLRKRTDRGGEWIRMRIGRRSPDVITLIVESHVRRSAGISSGKIRFGLPPRSGMLFFFLG